MESVNNIWYPFTQMKTAGNPIHITKAKGCTLYDANGNKYIDAISSWWVNIHGHANPYIAKAIANQAKQLEQVIFAGFTHSPALKLSAQLINILPSHFKKIFFSDDGSTSVEVAIKMSLQYWHNLGFINKTKIIAFKNAYHGDTFGAMSAGDKSTFNAAFRKLLFDVEHIETPNENNIQRLKNKIGELAKDNTVAAFIFEPLVQGAGGMLMYEAKYLDELIAICRQYNIICIADEVMTGFGRTGKNFAIEYLTNPPEIICLSKGITGGFLPLGVTAVSQNIFDAFYADEKEKTFYHGHSYTANPLACAAANASIELLVNEKCQNNIQFIAKQHQLFAEKTNTHKAVKEVRFQGTIIAIEFETNDVASYFNTIRNKLYDFYLSQGILLRPLGNVVYIMPPYCISLSELKKLYKAIEKSFSLV